VDGLEKGPPERKPLQRKKVAIFTPANKCELNANPC